LNHYTLLITSVIKTYHANANYWRYKTIHVPSSSLLIFKLFVPNMPTWHRGLHDGQEFNLDHCHPHSSQLFITGKFQHKVKCTCILSTLEAHSVGTKGVSQVYHLNFDDNKVLKIINWIC